MKALLIYSIPPINETKYCMMVLKLRKKLKQVAMLHMANFTLIELIFEECFVNTIILVGIEYVYSSNHVVETSFTYHVKTHS